MDFTALYCDVDDFVKNHEKISFPINSKKYVYILVGNAILLLSGHLSVITLNIANLVLVNYLFNI